VQASRYQSEAGDHPAKDYGESKGWSIYEKNINKAIELYRRSSEKGHGEAGYRLGFIYWLGKHRFNPDARTKEEKEEDNALAFKWFMKAAENGHWRAALMVGDSYFTARGTEYDVVEAERWYRRAFELGPPSRGGQILYGLAFMLEAQVMKEKAIAVYRESAREGEKKSQERLRKKGLRW
jgi:TPR repeat protein